MWISGDDGYVEFYTHQAAADYVLSLYPKEATPEPMTCRCKRFHWDADVSKWIDIKVAAYYLCATCPDCNTDCLPTGVVCYQEGAWLMLSTPYKEDDLLGMKKQKEETVKIKLSEAVSSIMGDTSGIIGVWIIVWGENPTVLQEVVKAFRKHQALSTCQRHVSSFSSMPVESERSAANIIIHVTGGPTGMTLEITKNRHGKMRRFDCMADCYFKESNMNQNDVEKKPDHPYQFGHDTDGCGKHYKHLHPDTAGYAECFRILREAKKDGVIGNWWYDAKGICGCPTAAVMLKGNTKPVRYDDNDGTKGDLGILREAADYVLGLRKNIKQDIGSMSQIQMVDEVQASGYEFKYASVTGIPSIGLFPKCANTPSLTMKAQGENQTGFLRRCVEYIRGQKQ